jgi:hypothetical protein
MKKKDTALASNVPDFFNAIFNLVEKARKYVGRTADLTMCVTYFEIGRMIVEEEQDGEVRAQYGKAFDVVRFVGENVIKNVDFFCAVYLLAAYSRHLLSQPLRRLILPLAMASARSSSQQQTAREQPFFVPRQYLHSLQSISSRW